MAHELKKRKNYSSGSRQFKSGDARVTDSFIVSNPGQNCTVSELHHCITSSVKSTHFFKGKMIVPASKRYFSIVVPQLDEGVFLTFLAKRQRTWKRQKVLQNSPNQRSFGEVKYLSFRKHCLK